MNYRESGMCVNNKAEFYNLSKLLLLGNRIRQWTLSEFRAMYNTGATLPPLMSIRSAVAIGTRQAQRYRLSPKQMLKLCNGLLKRGYTSEQILVDESAPDHLVELQAEVMNTRRFIDMRFALHSGVGMRQAYKQMQPAWGTRAMIILRQFLDPTSMDCLERILHDYSNSIIELATYQGSVGVLGWNCLFWEVRNY